MIEPPPTTDFPLPSTTDLARVKLTKLTRRQTWAELLNSDFINSSEINVTLVCQNGSIDWNIFLLAQWSGLVSKILQTMTNNCWLHQGLTIFLMETKVEALERLLSWSIHGHTWLNMSEIADVSDLMKQLQVNVSYNFVISTVPTSPKHSQDLCANGEENDKQDKQNLEPNDNGKHEEETLSGHQALPNNGISSMPSSTITATVSASMSNSITHVDPCRNKPEVNVEEVSVGGKEVAPEGLTCHLCPTSKKSLQAYFEHVGLHFRAEIMRRGQESIIFSEDGKGFYCTLCRKSLDVSGRSAGWRSLRHLSRSHLMVLDYLPAEQLRICVGNTMSRRMKSILLNKLKMLGSSAVRSQSDLCRDYTTKGSYIKMDNIEAEPITVCPLEGDAKNDIDGNTGKLAEAGQEATPSHDLSMGDETNEARDNHGTKDICALQVHPGHQTVHDIDGRSLQTTETESDLQGVGPHKNASSKDVNGNAEESPPDFKETAVQSVLRCHLCPFTAEKLRRYFDHMSTHYREDIRRRHHDKIEFREDKKSFRCNLCGKTFSTMKYSNRKWRALQHLASRLHLMVLDYLPEKQLRLCLMSRAMSPRMKSLLADKLAKFKPISEEPEDLGIDDQDKDVVPKFTESQESAQPNLMSASPSKLEVQSLLQLSCHLCGAKENSLQKYFAHVTKHFKKELWSLWQHTVEFSEDRRSFHCNLCRKDFHNGKTGSFAQPTALRHLSWSYSHLKVLDFLPEQQLRVCLGLATRKRMKQLLTSKLESYDAKD